MKTQEQEPVREVPVSFPHGRVVATPGVLEATDRVYLLTCLARHLRGDWGQLSDFDRAANEHALKAGERLLSVYPLRGDEDGAQKLWVITEADRSATTFLLPSEY